MVKLVVLFLAALAFQANDAVPRYHEEGSLFNYLTEIQAEVKDLTVLFQNDFPEHDLAIKTVTWQCNRLVQVLEVIINQLREETYVVRGEHQVFNNVIYTLEGLIEVFRKAAQYHDMQELKKYFVVTIQTVSERFEKLVTITNASYPDFRYTLKYLLVDFMTALNGIRSHLLHISSRFEVVQTPRQLVKGIHEYTREITEILKEFNQPAQLQVALRRYVYYVDEIVQRLQNQETLGHKELDLVIYQLTNKLREIIFPLGQLMHGNNVDIKVFRTKIVTYYHEIVSVFEQLVQLYEDRVLPEEFSNFLVNVIYHYWYAVRHVSYEVKFGHKIGFYAPEYYNNEFYSKYGYGLYERDFHQRFYAPYNYATGVSQSPMHLNNYQQNVFNPYRYDSLFPVSGHNSQVLNQHNQGTNYYRYGSNYYNRYGSNLHNNYGPNYYNRYASNDNNMYEANYYNNYGSNYPNNYGSNYPNNYGSNYPNSYYNQYGSNYYNRHGSNHYNRYGSNYYNTQYQTPQEVMITIQMLANRVYEQFQHNTYVANDAHSALMYNIREFIQLIDYALEHFQHHGQYQNFEQFIYRLKQMRMELNQTVNTGIFINVHDISMHFVRNLQYVAVEWCRWLDQYGFAEHYFQNFSYRFISFLQNFHYNYNLQSAPVQDFTAYFHNTNRYYPTYFNHWLKY